MIRQPFSNLKEVIDGGWLSYYRAGSESGGFVRKLEEAFKEYFNVKHALAMNSATSCLHSACVALNVKEVTTTPFTFSASASCILMAGGKVKFADIEDTFYNIDPTQIKGEPVIAVHLHGHPSELGKIKGRIIEDCSQAIGARYHGKLVGTIGVCGVFSFNQWKHITCGEGGMLITNDDEIAHVVSMVRNHGETVSDILGYNYRMTELEAAVLIPQFEELDDLLEQRIEKANYLTDKIKDYMDTPQVSEGCTHVYYTYPIKVKNRDRVQERLLERGIYFGKGGLKPLHLFPFYGGRAGDYPVSERMYKHMMHTNIIKPDIPYKELDKIAEGLKYA